MLFEKERIFKKIKIDELKNIFNEENVTKENMVLFIENINYLCNFTINGYAENWLVDSVDMINKFDIYDKRIEESLDDKIDETIFPKYIKLNLEHNKTIFIRSRFKSNLEECSIIYDYGCTPYDMILSKDNVYYSYNNRKKEPRQGIIEISNEDEYIKQFYNIAKKYFNDLNSLENK